MNYDVYVDECVITEHPLHHISCKTGKKILLISIYSKHGELKINK